MEVVVSRLKGARLKIEENFTHDNFSGNFVPRDSTLKSRKFLELDSSLRPEATGTAMFESKSDITLFQHGGFSLFLSFKLQLLCPWQLHKSQKLKLQS